MIKWLLAIATALLLVAHQDTWFWRDGRLVGGILPVGLAYHAGYSVVSALLLAALVRHAWPVELERSEREAAPTSPHGASKAS